MLVRAPDLTDKSSQAIDTKYLPKGKWFGPELSGGEILVASIPVFGMIPAAIGWIWRHREASVLDQELQGKANPKNGHVDEEFLPLSPYSEKGAEELKGSSESDAPLPLGNLEAPLVEETENPRLTRRSLVAAKSHNAMLFGLNFIASAIAGGIIYGAYK